MISKQNTADKWIGYRHLVALLLFLGMTIGYGIRTSISIAMVAMVAKNSTNTDYEVFDWDTTAQSTILSAFFWLYMVLQFPTGPLIQMFGVKLVLLIGLGTSSIATLLTPIVASKGSWQGMCALRVIEGLSQGPLYPSTQAAMCVWIPSTERAFTAGAVFAGAQAGTIVALATGGLLADSAGGWPSIFYVYGSVGVLWCILWFFFVSNTPAENRFMSEEEKKYIQSSIPGQTSVEHKVKTPWLAILKCKHVYAILIANAAESWGLWTLTTSIPTYLSTVLGFDIKTNGVLSSLPYLAMGVLSFLFGFIADKLLKSKLLTMTSIRKICNTLGMWVPAAALISLGYVQKGDEVFAVILLVTALGFNAGSFVGFVVNYMDISPNFASTVMGLVNGLSSFMSIVGPLTVGFIVTNEGSVSQWRIVFWIAGAFFFIGNLIFILFATSEIQSWNDPEVNHRDVEHCDETKKQKTETSTEKK